MIRNGATVSIIAVCKLQAQMIGSKCFCFVEGLHIL